MFNDYVFRFAQYFAHDGQYAFITPAYTNHKVMIIVFKSGKLKEYEIWTCSSHDAFIWSRYKDFEVPSSIKKRVWSIMDKEFDPKTKHLCIRNLFNLSELSLDALK